MLSTVLQKRLDLIHLLKTYVTDLYPVCRHTNGIPWFQIHILVLHADTESIYIFLTFPKHKCDVEFTHQQMHFYWFKEHPKIYIKTHIKYRSYMFRSQIIIGELTLNLAKVIFTLKLSVKLRRYLLCGCVSSCHGIACVLHDMLPHNCIINNDVISPNVLT